MLESSPAEFADTYARYAAAGELLPRLEGSFLLEFVVGDLVLYLFDRCGPYFFTGPAHVIVHGLTDPTITTLTVAPPNEQPWAEATGRSALRGVGQVVAQTHRATVLDAGLLLVLSQPTFPPYTAGSWSLEAEVGDWVQFSTLNPLHGYLVERN